MEIVHIPEKPSVQPDQQPTVDVLAAHIEPKVANTLIRRLSQIAPLESLRHVKRVRKNKHLLPNSPQKQEEGKFELCVILCLASQNVNDSFVMPCDVQELITSYHLSVFETKVCKYAATSKEEWNEQCKLWPTSFHPPTYSIDGITGFSDEDSQSIFSFMNKAIQLGKSRRGSVVNAAIIVDPSVKQIISSACDQTCEEREADNSCTYSEAKLGSETPSSNGLSNGTRDLHKGVSCLFPLRWEENQANESSFDWHPLRHAPMVAIESSSVRDRKLFTSSGEIQDESTETDNGQSFSVGSPAKRQKTALEKDKKDEEMANLHGKSCVSPTVRPYLCTGYDIYLVWEPCPMCAMALVHQRIRRIFFAYPNANAGALGSVYRLQGERSLNHHYAVFRVTMPNSESLLP